MKKLVGLSLVLILLLVAYQYYFSPRASPPVHLVSSLPATYGNTAAQKPAAYLITDVSVIPMNRDTVLPHQHVVIENGRIKQIAGSLHSLNTSSASVRIDGTGKYLIPGLNDMHVHLNDDNNLLLFIANGVTTVRNMAGYPFHLALREKINRQNVLGPTLYTASPILEGVDNVWKFSVVVKTKKEAREAVLTYRKEGYDFIKIYHTLPEALYREILRVADSVRIPVVGHIPFYVDLNETLASSQYSLEHVDVRPVSPQIPLLKKLDMIGHSKKWVCPTLVVYRNMQRNPIDPAVETNYEQYVDAETLAFWQQHLHSSSKDDYTLRKNMVKILFANGGRFLVGTDCLNSYVLAGFSIHEELRELVDAGLPAFEVLKASTVYPAEFLKRQADIGTIEPGKLADLVLLNGNPLKNIDNTQKIAGVMVKGKWFTASELASMLADAKKQHHK